MAGGVRGRFQGAGGSFLRGLGKISGGDSHLQGFDFLVFHGIFAVSARIAEILSKQKTTFSFRLISVAFLLAFR